MVRHVEGYQIEDGVDDDARIWDKAGTEYTPIAVPETGNGRCQQAIMNWLEDHTEGDWICTPTYIFFERPGDALMFKLGFK